MDVIKISLQGGGYAKGYLHEDYPRLIRHKVRPAIIVVPGGGYYYCCPREADPVGMQYFAMGYNVFILEYAILEKAKDYLPLRQLAEAVHEVRAHAVEWHIDPERVAVIGFSAGGNLVGTLATRFGDAALGLPGDCRPDAVILGYPVITMGEYTHLKTRENVSGDRPELYDEFSVEKHVTAAMPPVFLWHTVDDESVPVQNSLLLLAAMQQAGVPYECHLFAHGSHGSSVCNVEVERENPEVAAWMDLSKAWLNKQFHFVP